MSYSHIYLKNQVRIPTFVGVFIVGIILLFFVRIFTQSSIPSKAANKSAKRLEIVNLSPNQVTIYWETEAKETGWIIYGEEERILQKIAIDERDLIEKKNSYNHHYVILRNLKENNQYFFKIVSNKYLIEKVNSKPFIFSTPKIASSIKSKNPAYGKVMQSNDTALEGSFVFVRFDKSFPLLTLTKSTGEWLIPLHNVYNLNDLQMRILEQDEKASIEIVNDENKVSKIQTSLSKMSPLPQTVIIGNNYNFLEENNVLSATTSTITDEPIKEVDILYPKENALIPGYKPLVKGVGIPNEVVFIEIKSEKAVSSKTVVDNKGLWSMILPSNLSPGSHEIIIKTKDRQGFEITITRSFIIAKNGEQVLGIATEEPTITDVLTPTYTPTIVPTKITYNTPIPTKIATIPKTPVSGSNFLPSIFGGLSFVIVGVGLLLVF